MCTGSISCWLVEVDGWRARRGRHLHLVPPAKPHLRKPMDEQHERLLCRPLGAAAHHHVQPAPSATEAVPPMLLANQIRYNNTFFRLYDCDHAKMAVATDYSVEESHGPWSPALEGHT